MINQNIESFEVSCLTFLSSKKPEVSSLGDEELSSICQELLSHNYKLVLEKCSKKISFGSDSVNFVEILQTNYVNDQNQHILLFSCAIASLQLFVENNWTGPVSDPPKLWDMDLVLVESALKEGCFSISPHVKSAEYLLIAKIIFKFLTENSELETSVWWYMRCLNVNSQILEDRSDSLYVAVKELIRRTKLLKILSSNKSLNVQFNLEAGFSLLYFYQYKEANEHFEEAKTTLGLSFGFTGILGVRTKFQKKALAQLVLKVDSHDKDFVSTISDKHRNYIPKNFQLNDDILLDKMKFTDEEEHQSVEITAEEAAVVLAACNAMQKASPKNRLQEEETAAIVEFLLESPNGWCVYSEALRLRCKNEKGKSRNVERSLAQLEDLVKLVTTSDEKSSEEDHLRLALFYSVSPPPVWILKKDYARVLMSLGCTASALEIYKTLSMWEEVVMCLISSDRFSEAIEICKQQIEEKPTPTILCLFADLTRNTEYYLRAWELSQHRCTRAMNSLGGYYVSKKRYEEAIDSFKESLKVLSLQIGTWFTLGCTYLVMEKYEDAADSFRRSVGLDWDNFETWANLSTSYVRCGKKKEAFKALSEAIKCNFDQWQLWENYLCVSTDVGKFNEAIVAYNRLLDLKKKYEDIPVLSVLVKAVVEDVVDADSRPASWLKPKLFKLFGRITTNMKTDYKVWLLYAKLCASDVNGSNEERYKNAVEFAHKALRIGLQQDGCMKDDKFVENLIEVADTLVEISSMKKIEGNKSLLSPVKFSLKNFVSKLKKRQTEVLDENTIKKFVKYQEKVEILSDKLVTILETVDE